jgi:hypothetical protein
MTAFTKEPDLEGLTPAQRQTKIEAWLQENKGKVKNGKMLCGEYDPVKKAIVWSARPIH